MTARADSANTVAISGLSRRLRRPWRRFWRWLERTAYFDRSYNLLVPQGKRIYTPWYEPDSDFSGLMARIRPRRPRECPPGSLLLPRRFVCPSDPDGRSGRRVRRLDGWNRPAVG